jgi:hypothetical protein
MKVLNNLLCAMIVFVAYCKMGYYTPFGLLKALRAYFAEKQRLSGEVLSVTFCGIPLGTLLASPDNGALPVDKPFPEEMAKVRQKVQKEDRLLQQVCGNAFMSGRCCLPKVVGTGSYKVVV